jgi:iron complex outermembrane receptor protein
VLAVCVTASANELSKILEETTQIATKTRINADYVPGTVNIIRGEELKALGILNLNQPNALDMIVGMDSSVNALRGSGAVYGGQGVKIKWLLNGRALSSQIWSGSTFGRGIISFPVAVDQIERIEIIRGPDSAVYGDNAIFGVINIITKADSNELSANYGYQGDGKSSTSASADFNYKQDALELSSSFLIFDTEGYNFYIGENGNFANSMTGNHAPGYGPGNLPNGSKGYNFLFDARYDYFEVWLNRLETKSAQGAFGNWYPTDMLPKDDNKMVRKEVYTQVGAQKEFKFGDFYLTPKIGIDTMESKLDDYLRVSANYMNNATGIDGIRRFIYKEERKHAALDADYKTDDHHFVGGLFIQSTKNIKDSRYENFSYVGPWSPPPAVNIWKIDNVYSDVVAPQNTYRGQKAFYIQDSWDFTDKATITYGARYDTFSGDVKSMGWSPRLAIVYRLNESNILKTQYARAFRPPTFAETSGIPGIKSETVDTVEASHIYRQDKTVLKTTVFESRIYDMITMDDYSYETLNLPKCGIIQGVELEYKYSADSFSLGFNSALYKTRAEERMSPYGFKYKAGSFPLAPTLMSNIILTVNQSTKYPTTFWYHYISGKERKSEYTATPINYGFMKQSNGDVAPQDYLNITQQFKGVVKNLDLSVGVQNVFGKTLKTLYMPLNQPNNQDIPYMGQMFWMNLSYKF